MFRKKYISMLFAIIILNACMSIMDNNLILSNHFKKHTEEILIETPIFTLFDTSYNQKLGEYHVENTYVSSINTKKELHNTDIQTNVLKHIILKEKATYIKEEYKNTTQQNFSFSLMKKNSFQVHSECKRISYSYMSKDSKSTFRLIQSQKNKTILTCTIYGNNLNASLFVEAYKYEPLEFTAQILNHSYDVEGISIKKHQFTQYAGLKFSENKKDIAAISFGETRKIWLEKSLSKKEKVLLLAVNYSLFMFDWLDNSWRVQAYIPTN